METKVIKKSFGIGDFIDEQNWLEEQHSSGWKIISFDASIKFIFDKCDYTFEKCEAQNYIYQIDYNESGKSNDDYIQLFIDCGWEFVIQYKTWFYFRKLRTTEDIDLSIFSDNESRSEMCKKVLNGQIKKILPLCGIAFIWNFLSFLAYLLCGKSFWTGLIRGMGVGVLLILALSIPYFIGNVMKLNKMIEGFQNPINEFVGKK